MFLAQVTPVDPTAAAPDPDPAATLDPAATDPSSAAPGASDSVAESLDAFQGTLWEQADAYFPGFSNFVESSVMPKLWPALIGIVTLFMGYFFARYVSRVIGQPIRRRVDETLGRFVSTSIFYSIMIALVAIVASTVGISFGGITAIIAATGFAIGLAFQGTLSNFAAGVLMIVFRPFKVGDFVQVAGVSGKVNEIDLFTTTLDTPDNRRLVIPNSSISGAIIENYSYNVHRRVEVIVGVDYASDLDQTRGALRKALDAFESQTIAGDDRGSSVVLSELGDSAVLWKVRIWVKTSDYWSVHEALTGEIKRQLDAFQIGIPFPQLDVHLDYPIEPASPTPVRPRMRSNLLGEVPSDGDAA